MNSNLKNKIYIAILLISELLILLYFGSMKQGMHFDEFFSYFNTNNSAGRQAFDRSWVSSEEILQDFYVKPGEQFNYPYVIKLQGYDVHPPFYYILLHTVCSFMPGIYSMWQGIGLNIFFSLITALFAYFILKKITFSDRASFVSAILLITNPGFISDAMFIRMYCLMAMLIMICTYIHILLYNRILLNVDKRNLYPYMVLNAILAYLGFLTHYYYLVYLFFIAAAFVIFILVYSLGPEHRTVSFKPSDGCNDNTDHNMGKKKRNIKYIIIYCSLLLCAGILGIISFPQALGHVNSGYRGVEVKSNLFDFSDLKERLYFFGGLMNKYAFGGLMFVWIIVFLLIVLKCLYLKHRYHRTGTYKSFFDISGEGAYTQRHLLIYGIFIPALGYLLVSLKGSLMGDETMMRYQMSVYPLVLIAYFTSVFLGIEYVFRESRFFKIPLKHYKNTGYYGMILSFLIAGLFLLVNLFGLIKHSRIGFLFTEQRDMKVIASEHSDETCVYIYNDENSKYFLWNDSEQLWQYEGVYFVCSDNDDPIVDEKINNAQKLVVYISNMSRIDDFEFYADLIYRSDKNLHSYKKLYDGTYATAYEFF